MIRSRSRWSRSRRTRATRSPWRRAPEGRPETAAAAADAEAGLALAAVLVLTLALVALSGGIVSLALGRHRESEQDVARLRALNAADAGLVRIVDEIWALYLAAAPEDRAAVVDALDGKHDPAARLLHRGVAFAEGVYDVEVLEVIRDGADHADVTVETTGRSGDVRRRFTAVVRFGRKPSKVFDYAYFINNYGWLWGSTIRVHGDVRSNGNFSLRDATVNGDIYASRNPGLGALGEVTGASRTDTIPGYRATAGDRARPTNPTTDDTTGADADGNGVPDLYEYRAGFDGASDRLEDQEPIEMPYLGDLVLYENLARRRSGTIRQGGAVVVDAVRGGTLVLEGTAADPIVVDGPVVVTGDVVLKGVVTGQGTIYAGRNVHVAGDLRYASPPRWPKPSTTPDLDAAANATADLVGLVARGSVILGNYTDGGWQSATSPYLRPPFTQTYVVSPTDADIGYVTGSLAGEPAFHGDYTAADGGTKTDGSPRRFFESSLADADFRAFADPEIRRIDAILYTNHLISGQTRDTIVHGTIVCRDEAILYSGSFTLSFDVRVHGDGYESIDVLLPRAPMRKLLLWREST